MLHNIKQNTDDWLELRKSKIGASDIPIILGLSPYKTAYELYLEKTGLVECAKMTASMQYGHDKEDEVRKKVSDELGICFKDQVFFHPEKKWAMASTDGYSTGVVCEIKCANAEDHKLAKKGEIPEKYFPQIQWQLFCSESEVNYYCSYHKRDLQIIRVERDDEFLKVALSEAEKFLHCVLERKPPKMTEKDLEYVEDDKILELVNEYRSAYEKKQRIKKLLEEAEEDIKNCSDSIWRYVGKPCQGRNFKILERKRRGLINYKKLCDEQGISDEILEIYRNADITIKEIALT